MRDLGPGILRIGGNSVDRSWWTIDGEAPPSWATSVITPSDLAGLGRLLARTNWRAILSVNLGHFDPRRAASEAHAASDILGSRLVAVEIGNEPDSYGDPRVKLRAASYSVNNYLAELNEYNAAIRAVVPQLPLSGPDLSMPNWLLAIAGASPTPFADLTLHYYPLSYSFSKGACRGTPVPSASELLSPKIREWENTALSNLGRAEAVAHSQTRISETNNTGSCDAGGGPATSPVFASALWSFDWSLRAASAGVDGLNFHGAFGTCAVATVSPICADTRAANGRGQVSAQPEYYGLLAARQLEGGRFVSVAVPEGKAANVTAYATVHTGGIVTVGIDNLGDVAASLRLSLPGYRKAGIVRLTAPSLDATRDTRLGGADLDSTGSPHPAAAPVRRIHPPFSIRVSAHSAVVVTLRR
jgi:hypothetical protein